MDTLINDTNTDTDQNIQDMIRENEHLKIMIQNIDIGITRINKDLDVLFVNQTVEKWMKKSKDDLLGQKCYSVFSQRETPCENCPGLKSIETKLPQAIETIGVREDGTTLVVLDKTYPYFDDYGEVIGFNEVLENITEKKESDKLLADERQRLSDILEGTNAGTWDLNLENNDLIVDKRWSEIIGRSWGKNKKLTKKDWEKTVHPDDLPNSLKQLNKICSGEIDYYDAEFRQLHSNGHWIWINARGKVVTWSETGQALRIRGIHLDISQRKEAEENKLLLERQVQHAQKLESLGVLAGGIAHDFNNILMGVIGNAELSLLELPIESPVRGNLNNVISASMRANELAKQMLAYSGKGKFQIEKINVNRMIEEITHLLKTCISKNAVLKFNFSKSIPPIEADITQVRQVFMNLITNASEALCDKSGVITVSTGVMEVTQEYQNGIFINKDVELGYYTFIEVSDTGCGMDKKTQERVFDPFFTTKFTGRGLGMAATLGIIKGHKGAIKIYSELGKGTTFKVLFPCAEYSDKDETVEMDSLPHWGGEQLILVVDDEETVCTIAKKTLETYGFEVLTAPNGFKGLELFKEHSDEIALVVMDITMPHMDGEEAFREMRKIKSDVKVILSSGYNEEEATHSFSGKGLAGFIQKPYLPSQLIEKLGSILS